jgi:serralysin
MILARCFARLNGAKKMGAFVGTDSDDAYTGLDVGDSIQGMGGNDVLAGAGGDDIVTGQAGADSLEGGTGNDWVFTAVFSSAWVINFQGPPPFDVGVEVDYAYGGEGDDYVIGGYGDNLFGGDGLDRLILSLMGASSGVAVAFTGPWHSINDLVIGGGTISGFERLSIVQSTQFSDSITSNFDASFRLEGGDDFLDATATQGVVARGGAGDDTILGGNPSRDGGDYLYGDDGNDVIRGFSMHDGLYGGAGDDVLDGGSYADVVRGETGNDSLYGGGDNDSIFGNDGDDLIHGDWSPFGWVSEYQDPRGNGDFIVGGAGADILFGDDGNDVIASETATFAGEGPATTMTGVPDAGLEHDQLFGGEGNDVLYIGFGDDADGGDGMDALHLTLQALTAAAILDAGALLGDTPQQGSGSITSIESLFLTATNFADTITGSAGATVYGMGGDDVLISSSGADTFDGGDGSDTVDYLHASAGVTVNLVFTTAQAGVGGDSVVGIENILGGALGDSLSGNSLANRLDGRNGDDILSGFSGDDVLLGSSGSDALNGGEGNDRLDGGTGDDTLTGGAGDDEYVIGEGNDTIIEAAGNGTDKIIASFSLYTLPDNVENLVYGGGGSFGGIGNALNNVITGGLNYDELYGMAGNDLLSDAGSLVADALFGGAGDDIIIVTMRGTSTIEFAGEGTDEVRTTFDIYGLQANVENLTFADDARHGAGVGNELANTLRGGTGNDDLFGRAGNDTLYGGTGTANTLLGQEGDDTYVVDSIGDSVIEFAGEGNDTVRTELGSFVLRDNVENLIFTGMTSFIGVGAEDANVIAGGIADDQLNGMGGDDILIGRSGADLLQGGAGADQFRFAGDETGLDRILDFTSGADKIALSSTGFVRTATVDFIQSGAPAATSTNSTFLYNVNNGIVSYDADGTGAGAAVQIAQLNAGLTLAATDFLFY